jgi:hypothetical protein
MISGNSADYGGGVAVWDASGPSFSKTGGTIDATNSAIDGKVASVDYYPYGKTRNTTADPSVNLDSRVTGSAGGWE